MNEDDLWDLSDSDLETAFKEATAQISSPETEIEEVAESTDIGDPATEEEELDTVEDAANEEEVEEVEDGSEQPDGDIEDSSHDSSDEAGTNEVEDDNTTETDEVNPDGDTKAEDEESLEDTEKVTEEEQPTREYSFKANGKDYNFSSDEIVDQFPKIFGKAMDYTKKMQAIKPWRKTIDAIEGAKISHDDVSLMIDVLKGDKDAITEVLKRTGTDTLDLDTENDSKYVSKDYGRNESALAISDIVDEISKDTEYATTQNILSKEWDESSWDIMSKSPDLIRLLHEDVKSGMYSKLQPLAEKLKVYGNGTKTDLDYYKEAAQEHFGKVADQKAYSERQAVQKQTAADAKEVSEKNEALVSKAKEQSVKRVATKKASAKRKAAAPTKSASAESVTDYLDDSDESYDSWYKGLEDSL
jgi:hypothetical protein